MNIITRAEWAAARPKEINLFSESVTEVFTHWVGGTGMSPTPTLNESKALMRALQEDAIDEGYVDIEYNFLFDPVGRIFEGRGMHVEGGATKGNNGHSIAIAYMAGPGVPLTVEAQGAALQLTQEIARVHPVQRVRPHRAVFATQCPGDELYQFTLGQLNAHLHDPVVNWAELARLAKWVQHVSIDPLHYGERHPDVLTLKALLRAHGYKTIEDGPLYGDKVRAAVRHFKVTHRLADQSGKVCGADCARALVTQP